MLERFADALSCIDQCFIADEMLEHLPLASQVGKTLVGGIDLNTARVRQVVEALIALSPSPNGFTASDVAVRVRRFEPRLAESESTVLRWTIRIRPAARGERRVQRRGADRRGAFGRGAWPHVAAPNRSGHDIGSGDSAPRLLSKVIDHQRRPSSRLPRVCIRRQKNCDEGRSHPDA